ncbi:hypothetical protein V8F20_006459 [Naviculisporaceae sp. PSN 640]
MYLISLATSLLLALTNNVIAAPSPPVLKDTQPTINKRQATTSKYCNAQSICYLQYSTTSTSTPIFRIAIPDVTTTPFDTLLQIIAPVSLGWAGFSWGGGMTNNPLTVAWPNGNTGKVTVSSRWSIGRTLPSVYSGATYKTLTSSRNSTHWTVEVLCTGCSKWNGGQLSASGNTINTFAWAYSRTAVPQPANPSSSFSIHNNVGMFSDTLSAARNSRASFEDYARKAGSS